MIYCTPNIFPSLTTAGFHIAKEFNHFVFSAAWVVVHVLTGPLDELGAYETQALRLEQLPGKFCVLPHDF